MTYCAVIGLSGVNEAKQGRVCCPANSGHAKLVEQIRALLRHRCKVIKLTKLDDPLLKLNSNNSVQPSGCTKSMDNAGHSRKIDELASQLDEP